MEKENGVIEIQEIWYATPILQYSITPLFQYSVTPME